MAALPLDVVYMHALKTWHQKIFIPTSLCWCWVLLSSFHLPTLLTPGTLMSVHHINMYIAVLRCALSAFETTETGCGLFCMFWSLWNGWSVFWISLSCCIDAQFEGSKECPEFKGKTGESGSALDCANRVDRAWEHSLLPSRWDFFGGWEVWRKGSSFSSLFWKFNLFSVCTC